MGTLTTEKLGATVGAEVLGIDRERLLHDDTLPAACMDALEENGVLVFRELHIDDDTQIAFSKMLDDVGKARARRAAADLHRLARPDQESHRRPTCGGPSTGISTARRTTSPRRRRRSART